MPMNVTTATFSLGKRETTTLPVWQYDYGQMLQFSGIDLPETYEVQFATSLNEGKTMTQIGGTDGVVIPDELLLTGKYVYAWIFLHEGQDDGETEYMVTIPVKQRPKPGNDEPTPEQQDAITETIAALNEAVEKVEGLYPELPTEDGTYVLTVQVTDGSDPVYAWTAI